MRNNFPSRRSYFVSIFIFIALVFGEKIGRNCDWPAKRINRLISKPWPGEAGRLAWIDDKGNFYRAGNRQMKKRRKERRGEKEKGERIGRTLEIAFRCFRFLRIAARGWLPITAERPPLFPLRCTLYAPPCLRVSTITSREHRWICPGVSALSLSFGWRGKNNETAPSRSRENREPVFSICRVVGLLPPSFPNPPPPPPSLGLLFRFQGGRDTLSLVRDSSRSTKLGHFFRKTAGRHSERSLAVASFEHSYREHF